MYSGPDLLSLANFVNLEMKKVSQWFRANMMSLHPNKTKFTIFYSKPSTIPWQNIKIYIDKNDVNTNNPSLKTPVSCVNHLSDTPAIKFLGVYFDPALNFKYHISTLNLKLSKALFILRRAKNLLETKAMKALYYSTFHCHLIYGILAYSSACQSVLKSIITKQKFAVRCITGAHYNAHTKPLLKMLKIIPFDSLVNYFHLQFMADFKFNRLPNSFQSMWLTRQEAHPGYSLRNATDYHIPVCRTNMIQRFPFYKIPKTWNNFENSNGIKDIPSRPLFKLKLKRILLDLI